MEPAGRQEPSSAALPCTAPRTSSLACVGSCDRHRGCSVPRLTGLAHRAPGCSRPCALSPKLRRGQRAGGASTRHHRPQGRHPECGETQLPSCWPRRCSPTRPQGSCVLKTPLPAHPGRQEPREQTGGAPSCCPRRFSILYITGWRTTNKCGGRPSVSCQPSGRNQGTHPLSALPPPTQQRGSPQIQAPEPLGPGVCPHSAAWSHPAREEPE